MIIDVPTGDDFKSAGIDFLNLAWDTLISLSTKLKDAEYFYNVYYSDENEEVIDQLSSEQYWKQAQRPLSTALSLIQQGTEFRVIIPVNLMSAISVLVNLKQLMHRI